MTRENTALARLLALLVIVTFHFTRILTQQATAAEEDGWTHTPIFSEPR